MKILVAGVQRIAGIAKASGSPFDMCNLLALTPIEIVNGKTQINGAGFKQMEIPLDPQCLPLFMNQKFPVLLDIETEARPRMGKFEVTVIGIVQSVVKAA